MVNTNDTDLAARTLETRLRKTFTVEALCQSGAVLYCTRDLLHSSSLLIFGTNPGGTPSELSGPEFSIGKRLFSKHHELTIGWKTDGSFTPLQVRLRFLLQNLLGIKDVETVPYTNLVFMRTRDTKSLDWNLAHQCWKVNALIFDITRPVLTITVGNGLHNSPYAFLNGKLRGVQHQEVHSGYGHYKLRYFVGEFNGRKLCVIGLPHFSRYQIMKYPASQNWIVDRAREAGVLIN